LRVWRGAVLQMRTPHQHNEIEINHLDHGQMKYWFGGRALTVSSGESVMFWGALPHLLIEATPDTHCTWVTLPLETFLRFDLPKHFSTRVLHGEPIFDQDSNDVMRFAQWAHDWEAQHPERTRLLELELEARLRRLSPSGQPLEARVATLSKAAARAAQLAQFISEHHLEPITLFDIAKAASLNPNYAVSLFKQIFAMTPLEYLTQNRVAHAQQLLLTSNSGILEIAYASGFGSSSRFYSAFKRATGRTPLEFRKRRFGEFI
jgi:AraC family transcriptional regulator, melibiose operon regulatory protein